MAEGNNLDDSIAAPSSLESSELCSLCCEPIEVVAVGRCNHTLTCAICTLRLRLCYRDNACPFCKTSLKSVYLLKKPPSGQAIEFNRLSKERNRFETKGKWQRQVWVDKQSMIGDRTLMESLMARMDMTCVMCDPSAEGDAFESFKSFRDHLRKSHHGSTVCNVCFQANRYFPRELEIFKHARALAKHLETHPECEFCGHRFFGRDELFNHMKKKHCLCHLCHESGHRHVYFQDTSHYRQHLREVHFTCNLPGCLDALIAFRTQQELNTHLSDAHGIRIQAGRSSQRRQQRRLPVRSTQFAGNELQQRGGDGFLMIDDDMPPLPSLVPPSTRATRPIDRPSQQEDFPALPSASVSIPPTLPRKIFSKKSCPCGRKFQSVLVEEGTIPEALVCDNDCEMAQRRARLAEAFNIDTSTYAGAFESNFSIDLITWARTYPKRVEVIERQLHDAIARRDRQRIKLDRIPREWKKHVIELIDGCGAVGRSVHHSDQVEVLITDRCCRPSKKLIQHATGLSEERYQELLRESLKNVIMLEDVVRPIDLRKTLISWDGDYEFEWMNNALVKLTFRTESAFRSACMGLGRLKSDAFKIRIPLKPEVKQEAVQTSNAGRCSTASERRVPSTESKDVQQERLVLENSFEVLSRL